jgi:hypothetical protein
MNVPDPAHQMPTVQHLGPEKDEQIDCETTTRTGESLYPIKMVIAMWGCALFSDAQISAMVKTWDSWAYNCYIDLFSRIDDHSSTFPK